MTQDERLIHSLIDAIIARLPHGTGIAAGALPHDKVVLSTRATLVDVGKYAIETVLSRLVERLHDLSKRERPNEPHPASTRQSELLILELLADCCAAHWASIEAARQSVSRNGAYRAPSPRLDGSNHHPSSPTNLIGQPEDAGESFIHTESGPEWSAALKTFAHDTVPPQLSDSLVIWCLDVLTRLLAPPNVSPLPTWVLLEIGPWALPYFTGVQIDDGRQRERPRSRSGRLQRAISQIMQYLSACNWSAAYTYMQDKLRTLRDLAITVGGGHSVAAGSDAEMSALSGLQILAHLWVNGRKLSLIIKELCGHFPNLSEVAQNSIATLLPQTITRWVDYNPTEFIQLHLSEKRLEGGADMLFDMVNAMQDDNHRAPYLYPFKAALLLLTPDVFRVAGTLGPKKSSGITKKAAFLDTMRKGLRSTRTGSTSMLCLLGFSRLAQYFPLDSDSALLGFTLDVQNELRVEMFDHVMSGEFGPEKYLDVYLLIASFLSLSYLNLESILEHVLPRCFQPYAPAELKFAIFGSCKIIAQQQEVGCYAALFAAVAPHVRHFLRTFPFEHDSITDEQPNGRQTPRDAVDWAHMRAMVRSVLSFLSKRPGNLLEGIPTEIAVLHETLHEELENIMPFLADEDENITVLASSIVHRLTTEDSLLWSSQTSDPASCDFHFYFCRSTSLILSSLSERVMEPAINDSGVKTVLNVIYHVLRTRLDYLKRSGDVPRDWVVGTGTPDQCTAPEILEVAFLILLCSCSLEICASTTNALALYCEEGSLTEGSTDLAPSPLAIMRNYEAYKELCSPNFRLTGIVAFQKRLRKCLAKMAEPSLGILTAWETAYMRWSDTNMHILTKGSEAEFTASDRSFLQWRNHSGFLASVGGCCITDASQSSRIDEALFAGLRWIDRPSPSGDNQSLLDVFLSQCLQLLFCDKLLIRETTREFLGTELNFKLFPYLLQSLESELASLFENHTTDTLPQYGAVVLEQAALLLKAMVERSGDTRETLFSTDFESMCLNLAEYADILEDDTAALRVKIRLCHLCVSVTGRKDSMNLGHGIRTRNQLLAIIFAWISGLASPQADSVPPNVGQRVDEVIRLQRDLNRVCLQAVVNLTYRLPLQLPSDQPDVDSFEAKTQLFFDYYKRLLSLLEDETAQVERTAGPLHSSYRSEEFSNALDLTISALSNLLSANVDVGLKHALHMGYHESVQVRTAFLRVLCNILSQEADFERLSDAAIVEKYNILLELVTHDMGLVVVLCDSCSSGHIDELAIALLYIFESRGKSFQLLRTLIEHEVTVTDNESELLRRHCVTTKMLSAYARWNGGTYLRSTLQQTLEKLVQSSQELDLELDPSRAASPEELRRNILQLQKVTKIFIDDICKSADKVPATFRRICHTIATAVAPRFPEAKFTAVGAFIFLRFFCPAIVAPDSEGLVASVLSQKTRRSLLLVAKVVQNLANNVLFGTKEQYMSPLNDFLAQNIYRVTAFLRDISARSPVIDDSVASQLFDFGSCVALHRFLYDNWESVKVKLFALERRSWQGTAADPELEIATNQKPTSLNRLSELIPSLGTPQIQISWNSPHPSANPPHVFSRFQDFMLRNVRKHGESVASLRAIYDAGQSKDSMPVICIVLRTIEQEELDADFILFHFFKIASRMWHSLFSVFIDVTCYRGLTAPPDEIAKLINALSPSEITRGNLSRIYIYNMNSIYRKRLRRLLRVVVRNATNIFHPNNVDYHLIGSPQELQVHFNLSSLLLPKETKSVVEDTQLVWQDVIRISKTKGEIEVKIKIGKQYLQITTNKKEDIVPGLRLSGILNDVLRIADIEEAKSPVSIKEDNAFSLRAENGKFVMHFSSAQKTEILQAISAAKARHRKEFKASECHDRLIKPADVPGSLLNIALMNLASRDRALRLASYNAIAGLSRTFHFDTDKRLITAKGLGIPENSALLVKGVSEKLAASEPRLTHDFLSEFFIGWDRMTSTERPLSILYMTPWLKNLRKHVMLSDTEGDKGKEKASAIARKLIETAVNAPECSTCFQEQVWPVVARDESLVDIFLEEMVRIALELGPDSEQNKAIASIAAAIGSMVMKGKIIARLRRVLNRSSLRPARNLVENTVWDEARILLRMCLETSFDSRGQAQLFLPELFHIATMTLHGGSPSISACVHTILINTVHSLCTTFPLNEARLAKLKTVLVSLTEPKIELFFGLRRAVAGNDMSAIDKAMPDMAMFSQLESITRLLQSVIELGAPSQSQANIWRSRWMSLVASTAFQSNPAIQPRAFTVMGCLASEDVDDDLLYQVLVSLRTAIGRFLESGDGALLIAIVATLTKMVASLSSTSRYIKQLFWLTIALVRLVPLDLFNYAASLLEAVVQVLAVRGAYVDGQMASVLLLGRSAAEPILCEMDEEFEVRFSPHNFHVALTITLLKGLMESTTLATTKRVFSTCLDIVSRSTASGRFPTTDAAVLPYTLILGARATSVEERRDILWLARRGSQAGVSSPPDVWAMAETDHVGDRELLCNVIPIIVGFAACDDLVQQQILHFLLRLAARRPSVFLLLTDALVSLLESILSSSQNPATLKAAHGVMAVMARESHQSTSWKPAGGLDAILSSAGLGGVWKAASFEADADQQKRFGVLIDKLIALIIL